MKRSRYALWKNSEDLAERQCENLAWIATTDPGRYRADLLEEGLRAVFRVKGEDVKAALPVASAATAGRLTPPSTTVSPKG